MSNITAISFFTQYKLIKNTESNYHRSIHFISNFFKNKHSSQHLKKNQIHHQDDLFHCLSKSPIQSLREKAKIIKKYAKCPISNNPIFFECPNCGYPTHNSEIEWKIDNQHKKICKKLREANEDEHDLHSRRELYEFALPNSQFKDAIISFQSWYSFFYTRSFEGINSERSVRHLSKLLTYPLTLLSIIHEGSPYNIKNSLTIKGLKSLLAIRYVLHENPKNVNSISRNILVMNKPFRIFILGARAESALPRFVWMQGGTNLFPNILFHIYFIGPEASNITSKSKNNDSYSNSIQENFSPNLIFSTYSEYYHKLHEKGIFSPFDPCYDIFYLPNPGIGHQNSSSWNKTIKYLLETQCAIFTTSCLLEDIQQDLNFLEKNYKNKYDILLNLTENIFKSNKWDVSVFNPKDIIQANAYIAGFSGKNMK
ncbi:unnamed protein product [Pneumocystis jirovecii]|uniref:Vps72/YL1 C-terminal domain-containing protein n=2 Tax=Pneumocystis jirovecii TaxID=42068 RepID=L0PAU4_PNEJI|nr:uncharacterized protein T551_00983 [Pneumocystis jirovecii RU7]KTW31722.1 hypothetical protein T551_00983 [Pneumocystis jirovecii RU7]CCJ29332.1 unnamed protein product [Pneumocystis jirovecii]